MERAKAVAIETAFYKQSTQPQLSTASSTALCNTWLIQDIPRNAGEDEIAALMLDPRSDVTMQGMCSLMYTPLLSA